MIDESKQKELITNKAIEIANNIGIENNPEIVFYTKFLDENNRLTYGYYSTKDKNIHINTNIFYTPKSSIINTLAHEHLHYWQFNIGNQGDGEYAKELRENIKSYSKNDISPDNDYSEYRMHPIETDARSYAKRISNIYTVNKIIDICKLIIDGYIMLIISVKLTVLTYKNIRGVKNENRYCYRKSTIPRKHKQKQHGSNIS